MSDTSVTASALEEALLAAGEAVSAGLPSDAPWSTRPGPAGAPPAPGAEARAVSIELPGVGRLVLAVSGPLARAVEEGPPAQELVPGVSPTLASAVAALCAPLGLTLPALGDPVEVDAARSLAPGAGEEAAAVLLYQGDGHSVTLALVGASDAPGEAPSGPGPAGDTPVTRPVAEHEFAPLSASGVSPLPRPGAGGEAVKSGPIELLNDVEMGVTVELGRTRMLVRDILELSSGSVIELDRAAGAPIDVLVNGTLIARGEVVVIDEEFGIRITEVIGYDESGRGQR